MGAFIARQPNGLLCRFSTIVDCPTAWNMTEEDYIEMCKERAVEEAKDVLKNYIRDFDMVKDCFAPNNMTEEEFEEFLKDCSRRLSIIFLDIDGVMNNSKSWKLPLEKQILDGKVKLLKKIVDETGAEIVISSSWRHYGKHMKIIKEALDKYDLSVFSITPTLNGESKRGDEIRQWLKFYPKSTKFVILDDDTDMCEYRKTHLIKTNYDIGLTEKQVEKAIAMLNAEEV
jgi:hypothetical protein